VERHLQLSLYQYAVDHGAVDELVGRPAEAGGAELVQLGLLEGPETALVQPQSLQAEDGVERERLRAGLAVAAQRLRSEQFPAVSGEHCRACDFVSICPARGAGAIAR
jgi:hypothetical protein